MSTSALGVAIGDLDGDGRSDLAVAFGRTVGVLLGNGDGTFQAEAHYPVGPGQLANEVAIADLTGDGSPDLVAVTYGASDRLSVLVGNGDGTFRSQVEYPSGGPVAVADLNADGELDLAATTESSQVVVFLGRGDGSLDPTVVATFTGRSLGRPVIGDLGGEGNLDLVFTVVNSMVTVSGYQVLAGHSNGTFESGGGGVIGQWTRGVALADLDSDTALDLVIVSWQPNTLRIRFGDGSPDVTYPLPSEPWGVVAPDLNGDRKPDVVVLGSALSLFIGNGDRTLQPPVDDLAGLGRLPAFGDLNGDGALDLAAPSGNRIRLEMGSSDGAFDPAGTYTAGVVPAAVAVADFDRDGRADLAVANSNGSVSVLGGNGDGSFDPKVDYTTADGSGALATADLNGDGAADLAVANRTASTVSVLLGRGDGTFRPRTDYSTGSGAAAVAIADLDGDGHSDLVVANSLADSITVLFGRGDGTFHRRADLGVSQEPRSVAIADVNRDGFKDLAIANGRASSLSVLLGRGDGTFRVKVDYPVGGAVWSVAIGDVTGDGVPDLATVTHAATWTANDSVSVLAGNGDGTFKSKVDHPARLAAGPVVIDDLNGDGHADLAVAQSGAGTVGVLFGNGDGTFRPRVDYPAGATPAFVVGGDLNGDGTADLAVTNPNTYAVSVLLGDCAP